MFFSEILFKVKIFSEFIFGVVVYAFIEHNMLLCTCLDYVILQVQKYFRILINLNEYKYSKQSYVIFILFVIL